MFRRRFLFLFAAAALTAAAATIVTPHAQAPLRRTAYLTFTTPVALPGASLETGTYLFELADPSGNLSIVRVSSRDGSKVYYAGFTELVPQPHGRSHGLVSFGEAASGMPLPISVWYPRDEPSGRRFVYGADRRTAAAIATR